MSVGAALATLTLAAPLIRAAAEPAEPLYFPEVISLPDGFQPEGIDAAGKTFYSGSLTDGAVYRGNLLTGRGRFLVSGAEGEAAYGLELDRHGRLFVADGPGGGAVVYDASTGATLASYQFTARGEGVVHDVVVTRRAAYFTDSLQPVLYVVPIGRGGELGNQASVRALSLSGEITYREDGPGCAAVPELNLTGIETSPDGRRLISVQFNTGQAFSINPDTGVARILDVTGASLDCGNSLIRRGRTLYVTQPVAHQVSVLKLGADNMSAEVKGAIMNNDFDFPTASVILGDSIHTTNARFATEPTPGTEYQVVRSPRILP